MDDTCNSDSVLTQYIFGSKLSQILELEIDVNDGHAACDGQDDYVAAVDFLQGKNKHRHMFLFTLVWDATPTPASSFLLFLFLFLLTSSTLGHSFQLHIWLLAARPFMDIRQTVRARVPTITSHGWEATSRPWSLNRRANMVPGRLSCRLRSQPHLCWINKRDYEMNGLGDRGKPKPRDSLCVFTMTSLIV